MGGLGLGLAAGIAKLTDYQIINVQKDRKRADERRVSNQVLHAKRGTMYDRNGNVLASSVECQNIYVNPRLIEDRDKAAETLSSVLGLDKASCQEKVSRDSSFAYVKRQVDQEEADRLLAENIKGIESEPAIKRVYPYGALASQVLGVVSTDNEGVSGLEKQYDDILAGEDGSLVRERGRDGSYIAGGAYKKIPASNGTDIVTTLDANIQRAAEEAIAASVEQTKAHYGSVVVTDPRCGEILAACSYPTYNQLDLANTQAADMNLRVVTDAYEPGSVFKALVCAAALDLGVVTPETTFEVPAKIKVGDDWVSDADKRTFGMTMTVREIMRRSSNTGMVMVGAKIGADHFSEYLKRYGIGTLSGVDFPGEATGIVRSRDSYDGSSLGSMSFGQGISVSPIEITRAVGAIANKGIMVTPHLLKSMHGKAVDKSDEDVRVISEKAASKDISMMITVVDEGTGKGGRIDNYEIAGKTGTAQRASQSGGYQKNSYMASFMGFAPARDPRALVYITLDGTPNGSDAAAVPFRSVMSSALSVLGVAPTR
ncbi:penicillin-binding protein transpeptidase [Coriobacterium glomerans PW2]|uniref:Penicillin-binding protein transpeptidase n=2 Tax=Coriobacterium TaxID=33870 RepID=F2NBR1_CORGP|nr:penicillin-binding protein transpeptidase [Coriobacterium glomerans PW2]